MAGLRWHGMLQSDLFIYLHKILTVENVTKGSVFACKTKTAPRLFFFVFFFNQGHHTSRGNSWFSFSLIVLTVCGASLNESGRGEGMMMRSVRWGLTRDMVVYRVWADLPSLCHRRQIHVCALLKHMGEEDTFKDFFFFFILIILIKTELSTSPVRTLHFGLWTQVAA